MRQRRTSAKSEIDQFLASLVIFSSRECQGRSNSCGQDIKTSSSYMRTLSLDRVTGVDPGLLDAQQLSSVCHHDICMAATVI